MIEVDFTKYLLSLHTMKVLLQLADMSHVFNCAPMKNERKAQPPIDLLSYLKP